MSLPAPDSNCCYVCQAKSRTGDRPPSGQVQPCRLRWRCRVPPRQWRAHSCHGCGGGAARPPPPLRLQRTQASQPAGRLRPGAAQGRGGVGRRCPRRHASRRGHGSGNVGSDTAPCRSMLLPGPAGRMAPTGVPGQAPALPLAEVKARADLAGPQAPAGWPRLNPNTIVRYFSLSTAPLWATRSLAPPPSLPKPLPHSPAAACASPPAHSIPSHPIPAHPCPSLPP